jgi:hypothetical protein
MNLAGYGSFNKGLESLDQEFRRAVKELEEYTNKIDTELNTDFSVRLLRNYTHHMSAIRNIAHEGVSYMLRLLDTRLPLILESNGIIPVLKPIEKEIDSPDIDDETFKHEKEKILARISNKDKNEEKDKVKKEGDVTCVDLYKDLDYLEEKTKLASISRLQKSGVKSKQAIGPVSVILEADLCFYLRNRLFLSGRKGVVFILLLLLFLYCIIIFFYC